MKLSVCITTYNRAGPLDETLRSLAAQTRLPDELIVSDDASPDDTESVVARWRPAFPLLHYHRNSRNLYMPGNLNAALQRASGEYVANLHDADSFEPSLLEEWERGLDAHPTAGFVFCGWRIADSAPLDPGKIVVPDVAPLTPGREFFERYFMHRMASIVWGTVMARRSAYDLLLPFDSTFGFISDVDMWMRMCAHFDVAYVRKPLLILDGSPTAERAFTWKRTELIGLMQETNIRRIFADDPQRRERELARLPNALRSYYLRRILGRIRRRDWSGAGEGVRLLRGLKARNFQAANSPD